MVVFQNLKGAYQKSSGENFAIKIVGCKIEKVLHFAAELLAICFDFCHSRFCLEYAMKFVLVLFCVHWAQAKAFCEDVSAILLLEIVAFSLMLSCNDTALVHPCFDVLLM